MDARAAGHEGPRGQGDRRRQVRRLLRLLRAVHQAPLAPDPRGVPRGEGGGARRRAGARRPTGRAGRRHRLGAPDRGGRLASRAEGRAPTAGSPTASASPGAPASCCTSASTSACGCGTRPRRGAIGVFADNLRDLLLAAPAGSRATMGLDPGLRTGVKVAVVDATGKVVATDTIYPHEPRRAWDAALASLTSSPSRTTSSSSRSATAPPRGRPRSSPASWRPQPRARARPGRGERGRALRCTRRRPTRRPSCPGWTSRCAAPSPSPGACRTRSRSSSRSTPSRSASGSTSTTCPSPRSPARSTPWWRTA